MKIVDVERIVVDVPFTPRQQEITKASVYRWSTLELCKVTTDSGHVGWGETVIHYTHGRVTDVTVARVIDHSPAALITDESMGAGLLMALFYLVGKFLEVPVHQLMGRKVRDWTPISWWSAYAKPETWAAEAADAVANGYTSFKNKPRPWHDIVAQVEAISKVVPPHFHLDLDPNGSWENAANAIPLMKRLEQNDNVAMFESPIPQEDILGNRQIRRSVNRPIAMHFGSPAYTTVVREEVCDGFVIGGGQSLVMRQGQLAAEVSMPFWLQLVGDGLTTTWGAHLGSVLTHARWPAISCINLYSHHLLKEPVQILNGHQHVPDGPGLGVEIDEDAVEACRIPRDVIDDLARRGELYTKPTPRLIHTVIYPDNTCVHAGSLNISGTYVEGVRSEIWEDDGSKEWKELNEKVSQQQVWTRWEGR